MVQLDNMVVANSLITDILRSHPVSTCSVRPLNVEPSSRPLSPCAVVGQAALVPKSALASLTKSSETDSKFPIADQSNSVPLSALSFAKKML